MITRPICLFLLVAILTAAHNPAFAVSPEAQEFNQWIQDIEDYFDLNPELVGQSGTGWKPFERIKWFQEQRMQGGELPPLGARSIALQQKSQMGGAPAGQPAWLSMGPMNVGGRMVGIDFHPSNASIIYAAATSGGVWKSTNGGASWAPKTDDTAVLAVGGLAVSAVQPATVVIGTGEGGSHYDRISGVGILRSIDGGDSWQTTNVTYSVTGGDGFHFVEAGPTGTFLAGSSDGLWRSTDHGATWTQAPWTAGENFYDAKWQPGTTTTVFMSQGNAAATADSLNGVYKSVDDGATWVFAGAGQRPSADIGKTKLAVCPSDASTIYALYSDFGTGPTGVPGDGSLYRSLDDGLNWVLRNASWPGGLSQTWYNLAVVADPGDADAVLVGARPLLRSTDGGATFVAIVEQLANSVAWTDFHALVYEPGSTSSLWLANDHGVYRSVDDGQNWVPKNDGLATMQLYDIAVNNGPTPYWILGGAQDNDARRWSGGPDWVFAAPVGDGTVCAIDAVIGTRAYAENQQGFFFLRSTDSGATFASGNKSNGLGGWVTPYDIDATDGLRIYRRGTGGIGRTSDGGDSWSALTPPATHAAIWISISPVAPSTVWWVDGAEAYLTTNDGSTWSAASAFPVTTGTPTKILAHPADASAALVTFSDYVSDDHVALTTDLGATWTGVTGDLPKQPVNAVAVNPFKANEWFIGTDTGIWSSTNGGTNWLPYGTGMPNAVVYDLEIQGKLQKLVAATWGRGVWEADIFSSGANVTWRGSVYLDADFLVPSGATLTIDPGTQVFAKANEDRHDLGFSPGKVEIRVEGQLLTQDLSPTPARVLFSSYAAPGPPPAEAWHGITFVDDEADERVSDLQYCDFEYATHAVTVDSLSGDIFHCTFDPTSAADIYVPQDTRITEDSEWNLDGPTRVVAADQDDENATWGEDDQRVEIQVNGVLRTQAVTGPVFFESEGKEDEGGDAWYGITVVGTGDPDGVGVAVIRDADFAYCAFPLSFWWADTAEVYDSFFHRFREIGITDWASDALLSGNTFTREFLQSNSGGKTGIQILDSFTTVVGGVINPMKKNGILLGSSSHGCLFVAPTTPGNITVSAVTLIGDQALAANASGVKAQWSCSDFQATILGSNIQSWGYGLKIINSSDVNVRCNCIKNNNIGLFHKRDALPMGPADGSNKIRRNNFDRNDSYNIETRSGPGNQGAGMHFGVISDTATGENRVRLSGAVTKNYRLWGGEAFGRTDSAQVNTWHDENGVVLDSKVDIDDANQERDFGVQDIDITNFGDVELDHCTADPEDPDVCALPSSAYAPQGPESDLARSGGGPGEGAEAAIELADVQDLPTAYALYPPAPSPARGTVQIRLDVPIAAIPVDVVVYDVSGRMVRRIVGGAVAAGRHTYVWNLESSRGGQVAPGVYFVRAVAGSFREVRKLIVLR